jgi:DNA primase
MTRQNLKINTDISDKTTQQLVLGVLENSFGKAKRDKKDNYIFHCPFCNHKKPKLVVNIKTGKYNCWTCEPATKGTKPDSLLKKANASKEAIKEIRSYYNIKKFDLNEKEETRVAALPIEYKSINIPGKSLLEKKVVNYLINDRGLSKLDIIKYNIGYCETGKFANKVIIPSYDLDGRLNYFVARSIDKLAKSAYDACSVDKNSLIGFEYYINWDVPIVLCEGAFDAIAIKRNAIPLFGKTISKALMKKLVESKVKTIYVVLDNDALKKSMEYVETLINYGKDVYHINLEEKDPSKIGFNGMIKILQKAKPIKSEDLFFKKMQMIIARA